MFVLLVLSFPVVGACGHIYFLCAQHSCFHFVFTVKSWFLFYFCQVSHSACSWKHPLFQKNFLLLYIDYCLFFTCFNIFLLWAADLHLISLVTVLYIKASTTISHQIWFSCSICYWREIFRFVFVIADLISNNANSTPFWI